MGSADRYRDPASSAEVNSSATSPKRISPRRMRPRNPAEWNSGASKSPRLPCEILKRRSRSAGKLNARESDQPPPRGIWVGENSIRPSAPKIGDARDQTSGSALRRGCIGEPRLVGQANDEYSERGQKFAAGISLRWRDAAAHPHVRSVEWLSGPNAAKLAACTQQKIASIGRRAPC